MENNINSKELTKEYFNKTAKNYDTMHDGKFVKCMYGEIFKRIKSAEPKRILDLGCGNGNILKMLEDNNVKANLYGLDLCENMIKECKKRLSNKVTLTVGDSENLPYDDNEFDTVVCNASFHHYIHPETVLKEIKRVLKKDGVLILGDPTSPFNWYTKLINFSLRYCNSGDYKMYTKKEITSLLTNSGFKVKDYKMINYRTFAVNAINI